MGFDIRQIFGKRKGVIVSLSLGPGAEEASTKELMGAAKTMRDATPMTPQEIEELLLSQVDPELEANTRMMRFLIQQLGMDEVRRVLEADPEIGEECKLYFQFHDISKEARAISSPVSKDVASVPTSEF